MENKRKSRWFQRVTPAPWMRATSAGWLLYFMAEDLRKSKTKAERAELAEALEELSAELIRKEPTGRAGRPDLGTSRLVALADALVRTTGVTAAEAVRAAVGKNDPKTIRRVERAFRKYREGTSNLHVLIVHRSELEAAVRRLPKIHRIK